MARVLIVEDNRNLAHGLLTNLEFEGHRAEIASDGSDVFISGGGDAGTFITRVVLATGATEIIHRTNLADQPRSIVAGADRAGMAVDFFGRIGVRTR